MYCCWRRWNCCWGTWYWGCGRNCCWGMNCCCGGWNCCCTTYWRRTGAGWNGYWCTTAGLGCNYVCGITLSNVFTWAMYTCPVCWKCCTGCCGGNVGWRRYPAWEWCLFGRSSLSGSEIFGSSIWNCWGLIARTGSPEPKRIIWGEDWGGLWATANSATTPTVQRFSSASECVKKRQKRGLPDCPCTQEQSAVNAITQYCSDCIVIRVGTDWCRLPAWHGCREGRSWSRPVDELE